MALSKIRPLSISATTLVSSLGHGLDTNWRQLQEGNSGLAPCTFPGAENLKTWTGEISGLDSIKLPKSFSHYDCRNNRLSALALKQDGFLEAIARSKEKYGTNRIGVFIGTSTSGIQQTELAYKEWRKNQMQGKLPDWYEYPSTHCVSSVSEFVRESLELDGVFNTISTACSSSAKVFASAHRSISAGMCDAAIVGGVDSLCLTTLHGFHSLQLTSEEVCRPSDRSRDGISIGEAAGFAFLEAPDDSVSGVGLLGYGESGDAYHMSSPHPDGLGAAIAMQDALSRAGLKPGHVDYINLHGTGTQANDLAEGKAVHQVVGDLVHCSSTKGWTGHTLGAAGAVEAIISVLCVSNNWLPQSLNTNEIDGDIPTNVLLTPLTKEVNLVLSNSFGFGGSNCSLAIGEIK